ncbi:hypothetical protein B0T25DRAFT_209517 [Lasiosphaeria hispida]|uniref:Peptidase S8/S53 domain-containing protein n=1 Tax=Lasiosphaeria hispida TaxID=260671 RepID=A0AAJ0MEE1_9PEZI|nr:hypothetical protein B0T25DRAFT_209517 [Lasiosphaeria hispida]
MSNDIGHSFHNLDEDLRGWAIVELVLPLFTSELSWDIVIPQRRSTADAAADKVEIDNLKRSFKIEIGALPAALPDRTLSETELRACEDALKPLLEFLENLVLQKPASISGSDSQSPVGAVHDKTDDEKKKEQESRFYMARVRYWAATGSTFLYNLSKFVSATFTYPQLTGTATFSRRGTVPNPTPTTTERELNLDKLQALGAFVQSKQGPDLMEHCKPYLQLRVDRTDLQEAVSAAKNIFDVFTAAKLPALPADGTKVSETKWDKLKPQLVSCQLFSLLRNRTCRPKNEFHKAKLQLDGLLLDSLGESIRLDVFLSSCPPLVPPICWRQGWYTLVDRKKYRPPTLDLCRIMRQTAGPTETDEPTGTAKPGPPILNMFFEHKKLYHDGRQQNGHQKNRSAAQNNVPTMSLAKLLRRGALKDPSQCRTGLFTFGDKAVLALSLARCLIHLFRSSWMHEIWTADTLYFLHKEDDSRDWIFDIHHPYITCSLATDTVDNGSKLQADVCQKFLSAFAKLLIEIQTGEKVDVDVSLPHETFKGKMWQLVVDLEGSNHGGVIERYVQAILGCLDFTQALTKPYRTSSTNVEPQGAQEPNPTITFSLEQVREIIFRKVVKNLEGHYASFPVTTRVFQGGGGLLVPSSSVGITAATSTLMTSKAAEHQYKRIDFYKFFGFCSKETVSMTTHVQIIADKATEFLRMFRVFRERFIEPGMMNPDPEVVTEASASALETERPQGGLKQDKKPRPRIRIALLDTGVLPTHYDLGTELEKVKKYRLKQKFKGEELEPIKKRKSFVKDDKEKIDTCGHGTHLALLLLQYAPDADLYIAKVSSDMEFNDEDSIVKAIQWATGKNVKADIISMSFGCDIAITKIHDAIKNAQSTQGATGHTPLFFAAASNHGLRKRRSFPASDINVVGVYALDGGGFDVNHINPPTDPNKANFGTLGHGLELQWELPGGSVTKEVNGKPPQDDPKANPPVHANNPNAKYKSGTSYATPILAATVANYLAWLDCHASELGPNRHKRAREMEWIIKILSERMSEKQETRSDMMFVQPWTFFEIPGHDKKNISVDDIRQQDAKTTRHCLWAIRDMLKDIDE